MDDHVVILARDGEGDLAFQIEMFLPADGQPARQAARCAVQFRHVAARLVASTERDGRLEVRYRQRGEGQVRTGRFDAVINTTGPSHGDILSGEGLPARMAAAGLLRRDPTGLGIETDRAGRAIAADGRGQPDLLVGGPLARGTFGELMGLPEVSRYAKAVADSAADRLSPLPNSLLRSVPGV